MGTFLGGAPYSPREISCFPCQPSPLVLLYGPRSSGASGGWGLPTPVQQLSVGVQNREGLMCGRMEQALYHAGLDQQI